jgi:hypothetical protein
MFVSLRKARTVCGRQPVRNGVAAFAAGGSVGPAEIAPTRAISARQIDDRFINWTRAAYPRAAAHTRMVSVARIQLDSRKSVGPFKGMICDDISEIAVDTVIAVNGFFD